MFRIFYLLCETSGILLDFCISQWVINILNILISLFFWVKYDRNWIFGYLIGTLMIHFSTLFLLLSDRGIGRIIKEHNPLRYYPAYRSWQATTMFHYGMSFVLFCETTPSLFFPPSSYFWMLLGEFLIVTGLSIKLLATEAIGIDQYYYKDLFTANLSFTPVKSGLYHLSKNPMYGIGYAHAYGTAIIYHSLYGLGVSLVMQTLIYTFYYLIEKPHLVKVLKHLQPK